MEKLRKELEDEKLMNANLRSNQKEFEQLLDRLRKEKEAILMEKEKVGIPKW